MGDCLEGLGVIGCMVGLIIAVGVGSVVTASVAWWFKIYGLELPTSDSDRQHGET